MVAPARPHGPAGSADAAAVARRRVGLRAQLDLVEEIGTAVATGRDLESIIRLVGERVGTLFHVRSVAIALYDETNGLISWPFERAEGEVPPIRTEPFTIGPGLTSEVIRTGRPLLMHDTAESAARGAIIVGELETQSWLGVPMVAGERVRGAIILESLSRNAFDESDLKLLSPPWRPASAWPSRTRDSSTRRSGCSRESEARAAELALINEIGTALARQLDFDRIIDLVGDRLRALFDSRSLSIALVDEAAEMCSWAYEVEEGERLHNPPFAIGIGLTGQVVRGRKPIRVSNRVDLLAGQALAKQLDLDAIIELVGERRQGPVRLPFPLHLHVRRRHEHDHVGLRDRGGATAPFPGLRPGPRRHVPGHPDPPAVPARHGGAHGRWLRRSRRGGDRVLARRTGHRR